MAVPVYSPISDAEIEPGDDALATVFIRLRDNPLALLGVDTADVAPTFNPPSSLQLESSDNGVVGYNTVGLDAYTSWLTIADDSLPGELGLFVFDYTSSTMRLAFSLSGGISSLLLDEDVPGQDTFSSSNTHYMVLVSPIYSGGAFAGIRLNVANGNKFRYLKDNVALDSGITMSGVFYNVPSVDLAPSSDNLLWKVDGAISGYGKNELRMEVQTVGNLQQIRFRTITTAPLSRASSTMYWAWTRFKLRLKD